MILNCCVGGSGDGDCGVFFYVITWSRHAKGISVVGVLSSLTGAANDAISPIELLCVACINRTDSRIDTVGEYHGVRF